MRTKLQKFTEFANKLLPHETRYLLSIQQLQDEVKLEILKQVHYNCAHIHQFTPYDTNIDKRKYSNLKNWINTRLADIDIDVHYQLLSSLEQKILLDQINQKEEKQLLKMIRQYEYPCYYFMRFFEITRTYRHFLLIRMRYADHQIVDQFLKRYQPFYERCLLINEQLHQATSDIMKKYAENISESIQWEQWLTNIFYDEALDGLNRYMAMVRLTFICFQYQKVERLRPIMDYLDEQFAKGKFYSKRLLLNYYDNRLVMHTKLQEFDEAIYYGYLSIRERNHDYMVYINNLNSVLIRTERYDEALRIMNRASKEMKETRNFHSKIGYVSNYVRCLVRKGLFKNAQNYAEAFLRAYPKEILQYRWYRFFTAYLEVLTLQKMPHRIINLIHKYNLIEREQQRQLGSSYLPLIYLHKKAALKELDQMNSEDIKELNNILVKYQSAESHIPDYLKTVLQS